MTYLPRIASTFEGSAPRTGVIGPVPTASVTSVRSVNVTVSRTIKGQIGPAKAPPQCPQKIGSTRKARSCDSWSVSKGQETKTAILDEAVGLASRVGFNALTIGQLAESTGMSKSGLFAHFKSKEALQLETLERGRERFTDLVIRPTLAAPRGIARVRALFDSWLVWETEALQGGCIFVTGSIEYDDQPGPMRDALVRNQRDWAEFIETVARTAVGEGDFRADLDVEQFAFSLQGLIYAFHHAARLLRDPKALEHLRRGSTSCSSPPAPDTSVKVEQRLASTQRRRQGHVMGQEKHDRSFQKRSDGRVLPLRPSTCCPVRQGGSPGTCGSRRRRGWLSCRCPRAVSRSRSRRRVMWCAGWCGATVSTRLDRPRPCT